MANKPTVPSFQSVVKEFRALFTPAKIKKATTEDLLLLKAALEEGAVALNSQVEMLSGISISSKQRPNYTNRSVNNNYSAPPIVPVENTLTSVKSLSNFDTADVSLYDAEAEAREQNERFMQSAQPNESEEEQQLLEQMFSQIEDVQQ